jgi:hypothetical protein
MYIWVLTHGFKRCTLRTVLVGVFKMKMDTIGHTMPIDDAMKA